MWHEGDWLHEGIGVKEPDAYEAHNVGGVLLVTCDAPCYRAVEHCVGHGDERASIVDEQTIRVEETVALHVVALRIDCSGKP